MAEDEELEKLKMEILKREVKRLTEKTQRKEIKPEGSVHHLTDSSFDKFMAETGSYLTLVDFWASWCMPCRIMAPVVDQLAKEYKGKVFVAKLNVEENPLTAKRYNVYSIPTFIFFKKGKPVDVITGAIGYAGLKREIDKNLRRTKF